MRFLHNGLLVRFCSFLRFAIDWISIAWVSFTLVPSISIHSSDDSVCYLSDFSFSLILGRYRSLSFIFLSEVTTFLLSVFLPVPMTKSCVLELDFLAIGVPHQ